MNEAEIRQRLSQGEDSVTQFKRGAIGVAKLAAELVAFTNAAGGVIFFGVDDNGEVCGLAKAEAKSLDAEISNAANENVRPAVYPHTEFHTIGGKLILAVIVPEGVSKPYSDKTGAFWVKSGPDKRRVTAREELQRMLQASLLIHADESPLAGTSANDIDLYHFGEFLERNYRIPLGDVLDPGKVDIPQLLSNLGFSAGSQLTLAGVMLFAKTPQRFAPVNVVKCVSFVGNSIADSRYRFERAYARNFRKVGALSTCAYNSSIVKCHNQNNPIDLQRKGTKPWQQSTYSAAYLQEVLDLVCLVRGSRSNSLKLAASQYWCAR